MDTRFLNKIEDKYVKNKKEFKSGDKVKVHIKITEAGKERTQIFEGVVIAIQGKGVSKSIVVRKISSGVGVEKIIPLNSPNIQKIKIVEKGKTKRAKLYYMRERIGKRSLDVIIDEAFDYLDAPIKTLGGFPTPIPFTPNLERFVVPDPDRIKKSVRELVPT